jgi:hypothetical protein
MKSNGSRDIEDIMRDLCAVRQTQCDDTQERLSVMPLPGTHPDAQQANAIVFASCALEHPIATLLQTVGALYPTPGARTIFTSRIVQNCQTAGFTITPDKVPSGDTDTLGALSASIVANAKAPAAPAVRTA